MRRPTRSPLPTERRILRPTADLHPASTAHHCRGDYTMDKATIRAAIYARSLSEQAGAVDSLLVTYPISAGSVLVSARKASVLVSARKASGLVSARKASTVNVSNRGG